ncbi:hypothetical protein PABY_06940 [Pyrodictium abyssi]|uniref:Uncharacterized protein n=2 Tax=Pyrodictium abyssi TaxID=54256 RepID=A0ABM8IU96_9CREN|nr:hypothetical protein PABY_06940 [Pyrodictium abyssi]
MLSGLLTFVVAMAMVTAIAEYATTVVNQVGQDLTKVATALSRGTLNETLVREIHQDIVELVNRSNNIAINLYRGGDGNVVLEINGVKVTMSGEELENLCKTLYSLNQTIAENLTLCKPFLEDTQDSSTG